MRENQQDQKLLAALEVDPSVGDIVKRWPARCVWYNHDGGVIGTIPCDPYSRQRYMARGLRPEVIGLPMEPMTWPRVEGGTINTHRWRGHLDAGARDLEGHGIGIARPPARAA